MRLKHLKLAGFKSFVDPTVIPFTHSLSAVVGPNGCGKSNIIDAVRWVLGESSAKNLRGDDMSDVIFNGSHARKPVSVASVELLFDNQDGRAQGPWEKFSEISIKRQVSRQGQSDYFVNGQKCRRRDISDLLSGTGLGPRSYSIIEQGTISRLVESKPVELRGFIEDAAGISKYKERKRDTLNRIKNSRENLSRLSDLHHELTSQIQSLESQATQATQYTTLKAQERELHLNIVVSRWNSFNEQLVQAGINLSATQRQLLVAEQEISELSSSEKSFQEELEAVQCQLNAINESFHEHQAEITRLSLNIEHLQQSQGQQQHQSEQLAIKQQNISEQLAHAKNLYGEHQDTLRVAQSEILPIVENKELLKVEVETRDNALETIQTSIFNVGHEKQQAIAKRDLCQQQLDALANQRVKTNSQVELLDAKRVSIAKAQQRLDPIARSNHFQQTQQQLAQLKTTLENDQQSLATVQQYHRDLCQKLTDNKQQQAISNQQLEYVKEQLLVLANGDNKELSDFFGQTQQLWQQLAVEPSWQLACDNILRSYLDAYVVHSANYSQPLSKHTQVWATDVVTDVHMHSLAHQVSAMSSDTQLIVRLILANVLCADDDSLPQMLANISPDQTIVTRNGDIYTQYGFWRSGHAEQSPQHLIALDQQQSTLLKAIEKNHANEQALQLKVEEVSSLINQHTQTCVLSTEQYEGGLEQVNITKQAWLLEQQQWEHVCKQLDDLSAQVDELNANDQVDANAMSKLEQSLLVLNDQQQVSDEQLELLKQQKIIEKQHSKQLQKKLEQALSQVHERELAIQKHQMQIAADEKQLTFLKSHYQELTDDYTQITKNLNDSSSPLVEKQQALQSKKSAQHALTLKREHLTDSHKSIVLKCQNQVQRLKSSLTMKVKLQKTVEQLTIKLETLKVKVQSQEQSVDLNTREMGQHAATLGDCTQAHLWPEQLDNIRHKLANMGAINLTAIEQYNEQKARLDELTRQCDDLEEGLLTLEKAIKKIDRQSREKFKQTFNSVNADFQRLFPKVFGGGSAQLTLTDSDLLLAGVSIMAQPPGKKNSTIYLLSGGEKALTALSLVFAIFQLNPAPFCMLDEVDAPLDDANVDRYCNLVNEMSEKVQFIYITHNKVSMEMATQLTGVTMQEAGVSRIVAVDVDAAISMAQQ